MTVWSQVDSDHCKKGSMIFKGVRGFVLTFPILVHSFSSKVLSLTYSTTVTYL